METSNITTPNNPYTQYNPYTYNPNMLQPTQQMPNTQGINPYMNAMANSGYGVPNYLLNPQNPQQTGLPSSNTMPNTQQLNQFQQQYVAQMNPQNPQPQQTGMPQGLPEHLGTNDEVRQAISGANSLYTATLGNSVTGEKGFIDWLNAEVEKQGGTPQANPQTSPSTATNPTTTATAPTQTTTTAPNAPQPPLLSDDQTQQLVNALNQPAPTGQPDMVNINGQLIPRADIISALEKNEAQKQLITALKEGQITQEQYNYLTNGQTPQQIADALSQMKSNTPVASATTQTTQTVASIATPETTTPSNSNSMQAMIDEAVKKQLNGNKRKDRVQAKIDEMRNGASEMPSSFANFGSGTASQAG